MSPVISTHNGPRVLRVYIHNKTSLSAWSVEISQVVISPSERLGDDLNQGTEELEVSRHMLYAVLIMTSGTEKIFLFCIYTYMFVCKQSLIISIWIVIDKIYKYHSTV